MVTETVGSVPSDLLNNPAGGWPVLKEIEWMKSPQMKKICHRYLGQHANDSQKYTANVYRDLQGPIGNGIYFIQWSADWNSYLLQLSEFALC